ncbi:MAG: flagellar assembly peptidoglycan hydrolase FlgJ [Gammaproteobacteria bacterium]|nr:flagellar assembly peptidoglycan hydrolase FlgJ [Gammaproteobacteria bacterium]MCF6261828.1 flagellar assembly peptidoglycan hydrolase FlgJ [Gammaproteobacteria bacterium]
MTIPLQTAPVYTDIQALNKLKYASDENSPETLRLVAEQFEAIFLQMMLKSAHGEGSEDDLFNDQQTEFYQDWHDKQLAINLAAGQGIGIADMLVKQLQMSGAGEQKSEKAERSKQSFSVDHIIRQAPAAVVPLSEQKTSAPVTSLPAVSLLTASMNTPQEFVQQLWPHAKAASEKLGVAPAVILAQAALETGWGKKVNKHASGESSYNLFNIKADGRWQGESVSVGTLEFRQGVAVRETAKFRAYASYEESFADFVNFIKTSPRYQPALAVADDAQSFTRELSAAGYATDPEYANKIMRIATGEPLQKALALIKI